ncbi:MAG: serine hydrolase [Roseivirga sp.]|nr:serine hydrolase [Roseivirga sp.]
MKQKVAALFFLSFCAIQLSFGQKIYNKTDTVALNQWVDSTFNAMSPDERLGQLFMVAAYSNRNEEHYQEIDKLVSEYHVGGLIFFQGGPVRQAVLTNRYQALAKVPLSLAMDAEWGLGMRLDSTISFPKQMTLGAISDNRWIYEMGKEVANQFHLLDMHINFAPVVDVNVNAKNPVIGYRSFGENKFMVSEKGKAYMKGMQDHRVMANAKHFPGHGDTDTDSHYDLPVINHDQARMSDIELFPFRELMKDSLMSVMVAHLQIPAYDDRPNTPTTLSQRVVTDLLKKEMKFDGLAFTDAMNMQGVAKYYEPGEADVKALMAGNDVILFPLDVPKAIEQIKKALANGDLEQADLDHRVKRVLKSKFWFGLNEYKPLVIDNITARLNNSYAKMLNRMLYQKALTVVDNSDQLMPIIAIDSTRFASVSFGGKDAGTFTQSLDTFAKFDHYAADSLYQEKLQALSSYDMVVVGYQGITNSPKNQHKVNSEEVAFIKALQEKTKVIVVVMGNAYSLKYFEGVKNILCTYEDNEITQNTAAELIFGSIKAQGKLPVTAGESFKAGTGIKTLTSSRLGSALPEEVGMDSKTLEGIDQLMAEAIKKKATPGGQILIARKGKIIFRKNYGHQTYDSLVAIDDDTLYDLASITKVAATTQILMYMQEQGLLDMDATIGTYLPELKGTSKENLIIRDILTHQAGLKPYYPFWVQTVEKGEPIEDFYHDSPGGPYQNEIAQDLYAITSMADSVLKWVVETDLRKLPRGETEYDYLYSDMGYYLFLKLAETVLDQPIEDFLTEHFYGPLGLKTLSYKPLDKFSPDQIAPTEADDYFRQHLLRGTVHDQGAAMVGGVAGHAGLFSNAYDLAVLMQMNLQNGVYAGKRYFQPNTIPQFAARQYQGNRRGMGWDKPIVGLDEGPTSRYASATTFGHTGFTGTAAWADPEHELIYIFLANRIYPDASNTKLMTGNFRTKVQDLIYESIWNFK